MRLTFAYHLSLLVKNGHKAYILKFFWNRRIPLNKKKQKLPTNLNNKDAKAENK